MPQVINFIIFFFRSSAKIAFNPFLIFLLLAFILYHRQYDHADRLYEFVVLRLKSEFHILIFFFNNAVLQHLSLHILVHISD